MTALAWRRPCGVPRRRARRRREAHGRLDTVARHMVQPWPWRCRAPRCAVVVPRPGEPPPPAVAPRSSVVPDADL